MGSGSRKSSSGSASRSMLTNTKPPQHSTRTGRSPRSAGRPANSSRSGTCTSLPSRAYVHAWYGQRISPFANAPQPSTRRVPRWRHALWKPASSPASVRTTTMESSPMPYSRKSPGAASSSLRPAICQTRRPQPLEFQVGELGGRVALLRQEAVGTHKEIVEAVGHAKLGL